MNEAVLDRAKEHLYEVLGKIWHLEREADGIRSFIDQYKKFKSAKSPPSEVQE